MNITRQKIPTDKKFQQTKNSNRQKNQDHE